MAPLYKLYVHPPAFSLPSIDPDSLASILYLTRTARLPDEQLQIIHQYSSSLNSRRCLPALSHQLQTDGDGSHSEPRQSWHAGYLSIALQSATEQDADPWATSNRLALLTHLRARLRPLFAYHCYVSHENYIRYVRPAWSSLLPSVFHSYALVPNIRDEYVRLAEQAGLDGSGTPISEQATSGNESAAPTDGWAFGEHASSSDSLIFKRQSRLSKLAKEKIAHQRLRSRISEMLEEALLPVRQAISKDVKLGPEVESLLAGYIGMLFWTKPAFEDRTIEGILREKWPDILQVVVATEPDWHQMHETLNQNSHYSASSEPTASQRFFEHAGTLLRALVPEHVSHLVLLARVDGFSTAGLVSIYTTMLALGSSAAWLLYRFRKGFGYGGTRMVFGRALHSDQSGLNSRNVLGALFG